MDILTVNAGSASVKLGLFEANDDAPVQKAGVTLPGTIEPDAALTQFLSDRFPAVVGHRVVHGGSELTDPTWITDEVEAKIEQLARFAPLHNPRALAWLRAARRCCPPDTPQAAVFDTGFYATLPEAAKHYALPWALAERLGIRRYGFHGMAHQAMWRRWQTRVARGGGRIISLQLGGGCSATAIRDGTPAETSMGFSPLEGLVMATRSGNIDPAVVSYLQRHERLSPDTVEGLLNRESGLLGLSGESANVSDLLASTSPRARLGLEIYCHRIRHYIGAYLVLLAGADAILFGGGVGEHIPEIREQILTGLDWCGVTLDAAANRGAVGVERCISRPESRIDVWVMPVDEAIELARAAQRLLRAN